MMISHSNEKWDVAAKTVVVCDQELTVLGMGPDVPDGTGSRYDLFNDNYKGEPFDERSSGIGNILTGETLERFKVSTGLPWYDGGPGCPLSKDQEEQFEIYRKTCLEYMRSGQDTLSAEHFSTLMVADLLWLNETFGRIYAFEGQVNEFLGHAGEREYQAMWMTLKDFALDAQPDEPVQFEPWSRVDAQARFLSPRWVIKDLLAIFANKALCKHVFGV